MPFEDVQINRSEACNELFILSLGQLSLMLLDQSIPREEILAVGQAMNAVIMTSLVINLVFLIYSFCIDIKKKLKKRLIQRLRKSDQV